jgi:hypothetical protein
VSTTCSQTEVSLFQKDTTGGCLSCAINKSCIDDTAGDVSQECDDLATAATAPTGSTVLGTTGVNECQATLNCEIGIVPANSPSPLNVGASRTLANAYCGNVSSATCQAGSPAGVCVPQIVAGLPSTFTAGTQVLSNLANVAFPTGVAGTVVSCLLSTSGGGQCTSCVN